jgi:hypothetical protein
VVRARFEKDDDVPFLVAFDVDTQKVTAAELETVTT